MSLETDVGPVLSYTPYYVYQMMVAGACTLLKLCKSFFSAHIDMDYTKTLFNRTIWAIRGVSVSSNDLPNGWRKSWPKCGEWAVPRNRKHPLLAPRWMIP